MAGLRRSRWSAAPEPEEADETANRPGERETGPADDRPDSLNVLTTIRRFSPLLAGERWKLALAIVLYLLEVGTTVITVALFAHIVENVLVAGDLGALTRPMLIWVTVSLLGAVFSYVGNVIGGAVTEKVLLRLRDQLYAHTQRLAPHTRSRFGTGDLIARHSSDVEAIDSLLSSGIISAVVAVVSLVIYATAAFVTQWDLALFAIVLAPLLWVIARWFGVVVKRASRRERYANGKISTLIQEGLTNSLAIQADNQVGSDRLRVLRQSRRWRDARMAEIKANAAFAEAVSTAEVLCMIAVLFFGAWQISTGRASIGTLIALTGYLGYLYPQIQTLGGLVVEVTSATASAERVAQVLDEPMGIVDADDPALDDPTVVADASDGAAEAMLTRPVMGPVADMASLVFRDVGFSYPDSEHPVLEHADLTINDGDFVSVLGASGAGKSTLAYLLLRFYDPDTGEILLNGSDIRSLGIPTLRAHVAMLPQQVALFGGTVAENIAYGRPEATDDQIRRAAASADATEFIERLPGGFDARLAERGTNLSGGQRQRIALARAFLRDTPLLILDEPTTGLDAATTARVIEPMCRLAQSRTTLLITHDPHVAALADYTVEVDSGRLRRR
ncbi:ATP-binding cassette domain-containing protein [Gordonia pseudamarae]|jgi:ATP-binding cassette subfamily B protein|uniref:ATP-binding cassette domain-containing protein n=1 Tax=Gordonia pseudamarae TaxID=2831662 RepID=A0ABX6IEV3_9ACTN|nr:MULTISPECIES: ABC transporter ATP-binding protein [Gordonia]MBD0022841.1 ABC transporter ATP-binding protein [Gordonia sp. (in: high G+C Gram-positive bacteria)]QHN24710.1 ATP-binding cassette domain-containing protein [Gordonia pseudamarae]QHN33641.1 ATP-binding cassette domain-containing protein [Gordonia pseudamarae]